MTETPSVAGHSLTFDEWKAIQDPASLSDNDGDNLKYFIRIMERKREDGDRRHKSLAALDARVKEREGKVEPEPSTETHNVMKKPQDVIDAAALILASDSRISDDDRKDKMETVYMAAKISGKPVSSRTIKTMQKRFNTPLTDDELLRISKDSDMNASIIKSYATPSKKKDTFVKTDFSYPGYLYDIEDDDQGEKIVKGLNNPEVCKYIRDHLNTVSFNNTLYIYDGASGTYRDDNHDVSGMVVDMLHDREIKASETTTTSNIVLALKGMNKFEQYPFDAPNNILLVSNGALLITDGKISLIPHSYVHMKTVKLPVVFDVNAPEKPVLDVFGKWVDADDVELLVQILAQGLYQNMMRQTLKRNYLLQGDRNAGKSTYLDLVIQFIGQDQRADVSLENICNNIRFLNSQLESKLYNVHDDQGDIQLEGSGNFKKLTGTVYHNIERKGKEPYDGIISAVHLYSCNKPPSYDPAFKTDDAWWFRWEFISFPNSFEVDPGFVRRTVTPEFMSGLLNLVLTRLVKIITKNELLVSHTPEEVMERWGMLSNPMLAWLDDGFTSSKEFWEYDPDLLWKNYDQYQTDAKVPDAKRIDTKENFGRKIKSIGGFIHDKASTKGNRKDRKYIYKGHYIYNGKHEDVGMQDKNVVKRDLPIPIDPMQVQDQLGRR